MAPFASELHQTGTHQSDIKLRTVMTCQNFDTRPKTEPEAVHENGMSVKENRSGDVPSPVRQDGVI